MSEESFIGEKKVREDRSLVLPEFKGNYDNLREEIRLRREFPRAGEWREYTAKLPPIIGYVPEEERGFFTTIFPNLASRIFFRGEDRNQEVIDAMYQGLPKTLTLIEDHLKELGEPNVRFDGAIVDRFITQAGAVPRPAAKNCHIDSLGFLISSEGGTEFYQGRAKARYKTSNFAELDQSSLDLALPDAIVAAPPFAIVRKGPWVVHRSPKYEQQTERTFANFVTTDGLPAFEQPRN